MGDFILYNREKTPVHKLETAELCLKKQGSVNAKIYEHGPFTVKFFPKSIAPVCNAVEFEDGDFCGSSGCFFYRGEFGEKALQLFYQNFSEDNYNPEDFIGIFTVILRKDNCLYLITDPMGCSRIFSASDQEFYSSSFLATSSVCMKISPNKQAIYEYAFQETTYGTDTLFKEVNALTTDQNFCLMANELRPLEKNISYLMEPSGETLEKLIQRSSKILQKQIKPLIKAFPDKIITALSGGYDSRLLLSLLKENGSSPQVFVYGKNHNPDVIVAKTITTAESIPLDHIDKSAYPTPAHCDYKEIVEENFYLLDGYPNEGIFDFGASIQTRKDRAPYLNLNGGGGEIFRNFFYLPNCRYRTDHLINSFYSRYSIDYCQNIFDEEDYRNNLKIKINAALGINSNRTMSRTELEFAYPAFRLKYWTSRDNSINTRLGSFLTPMISYSIIKETLRIPLKYKNHGIFQAKLITAISPSLSSYMSDYGYAFDQPVPFFKKLKNYLTIYRPTWLRRYSYRLQHHFQELNLPEELSPSMVRGIVDLKMPIMSDYFKISKVKNKDLFIRISTMEYLFNHFKI